MNNKALTKEHPSRCIVYNENKNKRNTQPSEMHSK